MPAIARDKDPQAIVLLDGGNEGIWFLAWLELLSEFGLAALRE
jgi:hypothetical protein